MDFIFSVYRNLLTTLQIQGYNIQSFEDFLLDPAQNVSLLRHDIDKLPTNALEIAHLEHDLGVRASYYFRSVPESFDKKIIQQVGDLGHEIGYHYENLAYICRKERVQGVKGSRNQGEEDKEKLYQLAIEDFERNLERVRKIYPVKTICMHGSPLSRVDNRDLWKKNDDRSYGIIGELYFDIDFNKMLYLADTGSDVMIVLYSGLKN